MNNYNTDLTAIISTIRHGEKDKMGNLTDRGVVQSIDKGKSNKHLRGDIVLLHSGSDRVRDTISSFAQYLGENNVETAGRLTSSNLEYKSFTSHYLQYLYDPSKKGKLFSEWDNVNGEIAEAKRMNDFLNQRDVSSEPEIYPSPKHLAIRLARVIATEIDFSTITTPEVRSNYVNGSHEPVITAFLYYFLQDYSPISNDFIGEIGGIVDFCEGFDIEIYQNIKSNNVVIFKFRDIVKEIDQGDLKKFCMSENI